MSNSQLHLSIDVWLENLELNVYRSLFKDYVGVEEILWMTERDLKDIGVNSGSHRARMSTSLAILKDKYDRTSRENKHNVSFDEKHRRGRRSNDSMSTSPSNLKNSEKSQTFVRSWPSTALNTKHSSPNSCLDHYNGNEASTEDLKRALERELSLDGSDLRSYAWYHGTILRQRAEQLVAVDEDFVVRDCISQPGDFVITCRWKGVPLHFIIKKIILQPDTVYEKIQYCFEKLSFDSIPDFITYYVGSKCPLSEGSGAIIGSPINRTMPLSYYASRYGIQCQIHYVAKALEEIPPLEKRNSSRSLSGESVQDDFMKPNLNISRNVDAVNANQARNASVRLTRIGSDPMLSPNTERRVLEPRPNSGLFESGSVQEVSCKQDKPPPKPSRVPSRKCAQKPLVLVRHKEISGDIAKSPVDLSPIPIPYLSSHAAFRRQISETRFSFLDRPSPSSECSTPDAFPKFFTMPELQKISTFRPQDFNTSLLSIQNKPLEGPTLAKVRDMLRSGSGRDLALHLTRVDLEVGRHARETDLGLGVTSGLELILLPQGEQLQRDLLERTECLKLFIAVLLLTDPDEKSRVELLSKWIEIAIETRTYLGNFYAFSTIMLALTLPEIQGLQSTWLSLRQIHTQTAFVFETKLRPAFKALNNGTDRDAPNACFPYVLSLLAILQQHLSVMNEMSCHNLDERSIQEKILDLDLNTGNFSEDYGLEVLVEHLERGRNMMQQIPVLRSCGELSLQSVKFDDLVLDLFSTDFHLRLLWGCKGCVVSSKERHHIFHKIVHTLFNKVNASNAVQ